MYRYLYLLVGAFVIQSVEGLILWEWMVSEIYKHVEIAGTGERLLELLECVVVELQLFPVVPVGQCGVYPPARTVTVVPIRRRVGLENEYVLGFI